MKSPQTFVILLLLATTIGGAVLSWRQYAELAELRAAAMNRDERATWQKRVWELEKLSRELQDQLAAARITGANPDPLVATAETVRQEREPGGRGGPREGRGGPGGGESREFIAMRELMSKPEVQAMLSVQQKGAIEARYAALFRNLNLAPDQVEKLKSLLAERTTTSADIAAAAREQGINPRENPEGFRKLFADAQNEINKSIKAVIGDSGFAQLSQYERTLPQRNLVNDLQQRLSYTNTPLTAGQAEQLVQILAANPPPRAGNTAPASPGTTGASAGRGPPPPGGPARIDIGGMLSGALGPAAGAMLGGMMDAGRGSNAAPVTTAAVSQAQTVLAPPQVAALQQIQQQQQTQQQLQQLVRDTLTANQPAPKSSGAGSAPPPRGSAPRKGGE